MTPLLLATGITRGYGKIPVLRQVELAVAPGEVHVVVGPNGAGKSTLLKVLSGEIFPRTGTIHFGGRNVTRLPHHRRVRLGIGRTFQVARIFADMTTRENLTVACEALCRHGTVRTFLLGLTPSSDVQRRVEGLLAAVALEHLAERRAAELSHGDRKRLELALALAARPTLLLLDEPTAGMSTPERAATVEMLAGLVREQGLSMVLTEHDMGVVFGLGTRLTVLHYGQVIASGDPQAVRNDPLVREVYLGNHADAA